jgi:hypothetical protein
MLLLAAFSPRVTAAPLLLLLAAFSPRVTAVPFSSSAHVPAASQSPCLGRILKKIDFFLTYFMDPVEAMRDLVAVI